MSSNAYFWLYWVCYHLFTSSIGRNAISHIVCQNNLSVDVLSLWLPVRHCSLHSTCKEMCKLCKFPKGESHHFAQLALVAFCFFSFPCVPLIFNALRFNALAWFNLFAGSWHCNPFPFRWLRNSRWKKTETHFRISIRKKQHVYQASCCRRLRSRT